ncbi:MAG: YidC/Oxa1 family membrane protein insertase, partial [Dehalococcoidia bacterium]|nr:YidC/Oxa1 family membrane protein insertase [Dehalococcoidia bacterium]
MGELWNTLFYDPILNMLILLYSVLFHNFGLTIIAFTILIRLITFPMTVKQLKATKAMSALQPKLRELQKKHGKNRETMAQGQMRLYKEAGVSPMGCVMPMLIQFPIWIALYRAIIQVLPVSPDLMFSLSGHLYSWSLVNRMVPLNEGFLWLQLSQPDPTPFVLPLLVAGSMWVQQKMITTTTSDPRQGTMNRYMLWMMPIMFGWFTLQFPSGLALYWAVSNLVGIAIQYFIGGWGELIPSRSQETGAQLGKADIQRPRRGRSHPERPLRPRGRQGRRGDKRGQEGEGGSLRPSGSGGGGGGGEP